MSKARQIKDEIWSDDWFFTLEPKQKLAWMFLLTNERCNIAGIYKLNHKWAARVAGLTERDFNDSMKMFEEDGKLLRLEDWVVIVNFVKHQSKNPSVIKGIKRIVQELPVEVIKLLTETHLNLKDPRYKTIGDARKVRIRRRDGDKCVKCNSKKLLEVDHIVPLFKGGRNDDDNLQTLCRKCHREKTEEDMRDTGCLTLPNPTSLYSTLPIGSEEEADDFFEKPKFTEVDMELAKYLHDRIQRNNPQWKLRGKLETWAEHVEKLRRIDGRTPEQIRDMIDWTQDDDFWQANILSTAKLREKFNQLIPQVKRKAGVTHRAAVQASKPKMV